MKLSHKILLFSGVILFLLTILGLLVVYNSTVHPVVVLGVSIGCYLVAIYFVLKDITSPINDTILRLRKSIKTEVEFEEVESDVIEIKELNEELKRFSNSSKEQYLYHREYSENLSHELLTPLAVIRTKTELLLQSPGLSEADLINLDRILQTVSRLSKVNQALILLSKISNNQFVDKESIALKEVINESLENFEDQIRKKKISVRINLRGIERVNSNANLLRILIANLIKNAVFHNVENGFIDIAMEGSTLKIGNSGLANSGKVNDYFQRFVSDKKSKQSIGLGLAIVKQICLLFGYPISYQVNDTNHQISVSFDQ